MQRNVTCSSPAKSFSGVRKSMQWHSFLQKKSQTTINVSTISMNNIKLDVCCYVLWEDDDINTAKCTINRYCKMGQIEANPPFTHGDTGAVPKALLHLCNLVIIMSAPCHICQSHSYVITYAFQGRFIHGDEVCQIENRNNCHYLHNEWMRTLTGMDRGGLQGCPCALPIPELQHTYF